VLNEKEKRGNNNEPIVEVSHQHKRERREMRTARGAEGDSSGIKGCESRQREKGYKDIQKTPK